MSLTKLISNYVAYNRWANEKITIWLRDLDDTLLYEEIPSSFSSIDATLQHMLRTQKFWFSFITQQDLKNFDWRIRAGEVRNILTELDESSTQMKDVFSSFSDDELLCDLKLEMPWAKNNLNRYEYIVHVINHNTYHRGQIVTISRVLGIKDSIPATDYNFFNLK